jgi:cell division protein FtsL
MKHILFIATILLPVIAIVLFVSQIMFTNNLAQDGSTLKNITVKIDALTVENERLEQQIASQSSLFVIQQKAVAQGFVEAKHFLTIAQGQYLVAFNQKR